MPQNNTPIMEGKGGKVKGGAGGTESGIWGLSNSQRKVGGRGDAKGHLTTTKQ